METNNQKTVYQEYAEDFKNMPAEELMVSLIARLVTTDGQAGK